LAGGRNTLKKKPRLSRGITTLAANQTVVAVPVVVELVEVQDPAVTVPVEDRDAEVTVGVTHNMQYAVRATAL